MTERDRILKTLRNLPGVVQKGEWDGVFFSGEDRKAIVFADGKILIQNDNATLADAIAALTPPAEPRKPTYEFVAGLRGAKHEPGGWWIITFRSKYRRVSFSFTEDGSIEAAHNYSLRGTCVQLATPQTQAEVLATLKVCGVEVEG